MEPPESEESGLLILPSAAEPVPPAKEKERNRGCFWGAIYTTVRDVLLTSRLNALLVFVPAAIAADSLRLGKAWTFTFTLIAIVPLAERLGFVTEQLAMHTNSTVGGLMNATFGNATEVIVAVFALRGGLLRVVQMSLLGSILSNMLLVLGTSFFLGGCFVRVQRFNQTAALVNSGLLLMAVMGLLLPAVLYATHTELRDGKSELFLSRFSSVLMLIAYGAYIYFQLKSHRDLYTDDDEVSQHSSRTVQVELSERHTWDAFDNAHVAELQPLDGEDDAPDGRGLSPSPSDRHVAFPGPLDKPAEKDKQLKPLNSYADMADAGSLTRGRNRPPNPNPVCCCGHQTPNPLVSTAAASDDVTKNVDTGDDEESVLGFWGSVGWLAAITVLIAVLSDRLVATLQGAAQAWHVSVAFISVIVLPIVGNAAEHASAVMFACRNRLDITLGVAIGSSTQIAMFVTPFCVVLGWALGRPLDLNFQLFETATLFMTVLVVVILLQDGTSNWLKGLLLVFCYLIVGASFFVHQDQIASVSSTASGGRPSPPN